MKTRVSDAIFLTIKCITNTSVCVLQYICCKGSPNKRSFLLVDIDSSVVYVLSDRFRCGVQDMGIESDQRYEGMPQKDTCHSNFTVLKCFP